MEAHAQARSAASRVETRRHLAEQGLSTQLTSTDRGLGPSREVPLFALEIRRLHLQAPSIRDQAHLARDIFSASGSETRSSVCDWENRPNHRFHPGIEHTLASATVSPNA